MRKNKTAVVDILKPFAGSIVGVIIISGILLFQIGSLLPGISQPELTSVQTVQARTLGAREILTENPLYLPHQAGLYALEKLGFTGVGAIRAIGAVFGILASASLYSILKHWHTRRIALLGTALFASSSWLLHMSRLAIPEVSYLLLPVFIMLGTWLERGKWPFITISGLMIGGISLLYLPGLVWLIVPAVIWQRKRLAERLGEISKTWLILLSMGCLVLILPLLYSLVMHPSLVKTWLGLTQDFPGVLEFAKNLAKVPLTVFIRSEGNPVISLGHLPLLDIVTSGLIFLGAYWYFFQRKLDRSKLILAALLFTSVLIALNTTFFSTLLQPFLYLLAAAGITLLLQQWFTVFPRNPLARGVGIVLVVIMLALTGFYHLQHYFIAWPNAPETKQAFSIDI